MAKFKEPNENKDNENKEALENLGIEIKLIDNTTGEKYKIEDSIATSIKFNEHHNRLFLRIKGKSSVMISIPQKILPKFIAIETKTQNIW